jgi:hypothetical protein
MAISRPRARLGSSLHLDDRSADASIPRVPGQTERLVALMSVVNGPGNKLISVTFELAQFQTIPTSCLMVWNQNSGGAISGATPQEECVFYVFPS